MKTRRLLLVLVGFFALVLASARAVSPGSPAPDFTLTDLSGQPRTLAEYRGRVVVLEWHNPDCPFVRKHYESGNIPNTQRAAVAGGAVWLTINSGAPGQQGSDYSPQQFGAYLAKAGAAPTAYLRDPDGKVGRAYGAKTTPHVFVINPQGTVVYAGAIDSIRSSQVADIQRATNYVTEALADLRAGRAVVKASTQPYGCNVHY